MSETPDDDALVLAGEALSRAQDLDCEAVNLSAALRELQLALSRLAAKLREEQGDG
jgi:hypothetical protein